MAAFTGSFESDVVRGERLGQPLTFWIQDKEGEPDARLFDQTDLQSAGIVTGDTSHGSVVFVMAWNCRENFFMTAIGCTGGRRVMGVMAGGAFVVLMGSPNDHRRVVWDAITEMAFIA